VGDPRLAVFAGAGMIGEADDGHWSKVANFCVCQMSQLERQKPTQPSRLSKIVTLLRKIKPGPATQATQSLAATWPTTAKMYLSKNIATQKRCSSGSVR